MAENPVGQDQIKRVQLAQRRKALGLTQEQLAEQLGVDRSTVQRWERGEAQPKPWLQPGWQKRYGFRRTAFSSC